MLSMSYRTNLYDACQVLFPPDIQFTIDFLKGLEPSTLKKAYRKKAFETHPDRYRVAGISEAEMEKRFMKVSFAYEILLPFVNEDKRISIITCAKKAKKERTSKKEGDVDHFYKGIFPRREMLTGQYLYYSGIISWKTLINAIIWQKKQRPLFGRIARDWGILSSYDVIRILSERSFKEKFGKYALRKGYINTFQKMAIIGRQRKLQRPIGEYFVEKDILSSTQMNEVVNNVRLRNIKIRHFVGKYV